MSLKSFAHAAVLGVAVAVLAGCIPGQSARQEPQFTIQTIDEGIDRDEAIVAARTAVSDERLAPILAARGFRVVSVERPTLTYNTVQNPIVVEVKFDTPLPEGSWPMEQPTMGHDIKSVTGVIWLVDAAVPEVAAVAPVWGRTHVEY
jgi:hypothetical protein